MALDPRVAGLEPVRLRRSGEEHVAVPLPREPLVLVGRVGGRLRDVQLLACVGRVVVQVHRGRLRRPVVTRQIEDVELPVGGHLGRRQHVEGRQLRGALEGDVIRMREERPEALAFGQLEAEGLGRELLVESDLQHLDGAQGETVEQACRS